MAQISVQKITPDLKEEIEFSSADVAGDTFINDGKTIIEAVNDSETEVTLTIHSQKKCSHGFMHDLTIVLKANTRQHIGPFEQVRFNDNNDCVNISYDNVTNITIAATKRGNKANYLYILTSDEYLISTSDDYILVL